MSRTRTLSLGVAALLLLAVAALLPLSAPTAHAAPLSITVQGNRLVDGNGNTIHLHGVNRSGTEYACIQNFGIFDGPSDAASVAAIASWGANYVRVPLNEDCWLGINGAPAQYSGQNYINAITAYVALLNSQGMYAEVSLIWGAPGTYLATYQPGGPDEDHSPAMWASMAQTFKANNAVILAPWGETTDDANCFLNGGVCEATYGPSNTPYDTAGMQQAVSVMRGAGYTGPIAIPGIDYANDLTGWLSHEPSDPAHQLVAEAHVYGNNSCGAQNNGSCLNTTMDPVAAVVPLILGETGETYDGSECGSANMQTILGWADAHGVGWAAWTWDTWGDCTTLSLISNYNGTVESGSGYAAFIHTHMLSYGTSGGGTPTPTNTATNTATPNPTGTPTGGGHFVAIGFAIGWQMPAAPPWGDITQEDLFALQTTNGTALDTHFLAGVNVPAFTAAAHAHGVQALITVGGSADQNWQNACVGSNRAGFITNLIAYMVSNGFDGVDLDIEDDAWAAVGPPDADMTACIQAISTAARATKTQTGAVPLVSADVITNWEGPWYAPAQASVDQFNLMTYGDTTGGSLQADVQTTISQGLPAAKMVAGIDVIDAPATDNECGPFATYAESAGLLGAFVWDEATDEGRGYPCFNQFAPFLSGGGGGPTPTPTPFTPTPTPVPPTPTPPTSTPTPTPPTPTPQPTNTPTPSPTPTGGGGLTLLQSTTAFIDYAGVNTSYGELPADVGANHLLVAEIAVAGGNNYTVGSVSSELGDTWHRAVWGQNGDETDTEIWWTNTASAGSDGVTATLVRGPGSTSVFVQTLITLSEWSGPGALDGASAHASGLTKHGSGTLAAHAGDVVVGLYADAGYDCALTSNGSGALPLGTAQASSEAEQGIQSYQIATGTTASVTYTSARNAYGEVAAAAFRPT